MIKKSISLIVVLMLLLVSACSSYESVPADVLMRFENAVNKQDVEAFVFCFDSKTRELMVGLANITVDVLGSVIGGAVGLVGGDYGKYAVDVVGTSIKSANANADKLNPFADELNKELDRLGVKPPTPTPQQQQIPKIRLAAKSTIMHKEMNRATIIFNATITYPDGKVESVDDTMEVIKEGEKWYKDGKWYIYGPGEAAKSVKSLIDALKRIEAPQK
jgi:hypothetical protein